MGVTPQAPLPCCPGSGQVVEVPPDWPGNSYYRPCPVCGAHVAAPPTKGRIRKHVAGKGSGPEEPETPSESLHPIAAEECQQVRARLDNLSRGLTQTSEQIRAWRNGEAGADDPPSFVVEWTIQHLRDISRSLLWCSAALHIVRAYQEQQVKQGSHRRTRRQGGPRNE